MACSHVVECLRNREIEPEAFATSKYDSSYEPSNALIYDKNSEFCSYGRPGDWWGVFFKVPVSIAGYQIEKFSVNSGSCALYNWTLSLSIDNKTWILVHGPIQSTSTDYSYNFSQSYNALYARIDGNSLWSYDKTAIFFHYIMFFGLPTIVKIKVMTYLTRREMNLNLMRVVFLLYS